MRRAMFSPQPASDDGLPEGFARALDESAADVHLDRTEGLRDFVKRKEVELEAHLAQENAQER